MFVTAEPGGEVPGTAPRPQQLSKQLHFQQMDRTAFPHRQTQSELASSEWQTPQALGRQGGRLTTHPSLSEAGTCGARPTTPVGHAAPLPGCLYWVPEGDLHLTFYSEAAMQEYETTHFTHVYRSPMVNQTVTSTRGCAGREQSIPPGTAAQRLREVAGRRARGARRCDAPPASQSPLASLGTNVVSPYLVILRFLFQLHWEPRNTLVSPGSCDTEFNQPAAHSRKTQPLLFLANVFWWQAPETDIMSQRYMTCKIILCAILPTVLNLSSKGPQ